MNSHIVGTTIKYIISKVIPALLLTVIYAIYSRVLSQSEYGTYQAIWVYLGICVIFTNFGLSKYILTYVGQNGLVGQLKILKITLVISVLGLIPVSIYFFVVQEYFTSVTSLGFLVLLFSQSF